MSMRKFFLVFLFPGFMTSLAAQEVAVDSKGEPVFQWYSKDDARLQFSRRAPVSASYLFGVREKEDHRFSGILAQLAVLNSGDLPLVGKLKDIRPGAGVKLGFQNSFEPFRDQGQHGKTMHSWGVNAFFSVDNLRLYDTLTRSSGKKYPLTYGAEANYTFFFGEGRPEGDWKHALSLYTAFSSTWNDHNLLSYQELSKTTLGPGLVALQDFEGRYGHLNRNFFKYRMAVSLPMFYKRINPTPYWAAIFGTQNSPSYHIGVFTNVLAAPLAASGGKMPSSFGLGFDWVYATEHLSSKVNLFLKIAVSLGRLKEKHPMGSE